MPDKYYFELLSQTIGRFETSYKKYVVPSLSKKKINECICKEGDLEISTPSPTFQSTEVDQKTLRIISATEHFEALKDIVDLDQPKIVIWNYMTKKELENFLNLSDQKSREKIIEEKLGDNFIKGSCRQTFVELMDSVTIFCQKLELNVEEIGAILSIFYLTHRYFTSSAYRTALETYTYFKEFLFCVSISCPPESIKLLDLSKSKEILRFFCRIYLRNLPLIRMMCSPNYGFFVNYHVEPDELEQLIKAAKAKKGKDKKGKKDKKEKKKKK